MTGQQEPKHICLFGTSADPPTGEGGHIGIVTHLASSPHYDEVWVLPVYRHMFASKRANLTNFEDRLAMCHLAFDDLNPKIKVSDYERICFEKLVQGRKEEDICSIRVGTADLLQMLTQTYPNAIFTLALGSDTFVDFSQGKWKQADRILTMLHGRILVFYRSSGGNEAWDDLQKCVKEFNLQGNAMVETLKLPSLSSISSSLIRNCTDEEVLKQNLSLKVLEYIRERKLYAFGQH